MKSTSTTRRRHIVAALGMALLAAMSAPASALLGIGADTDGVVSTGGLTGTLDVDAMVLVGDPDLDELDGLGDLLDELDLDDLDGLGDLLDELDLDDLDLGDLLPDIGLPDIGLPGGGEGDGPELGDGGLVDLGQILLDGNSLSVLNNVLAGSDILNDLDIQIGDSDTLNEILGLANLVPGPGNGGGDDDDEGEEGDEEDEDAGDNDDSEVQAAGAAAPVKPSATAKPDSGPALVGAAILEHPTSIAAPLVEVAGAQETAPTRAPLPRTGGPAGLAGIAAALLGGSGAIRMMIRRRRDES